MVITMKKKKTQGEPYYIESRMARILDLPLSVMPDVFHLDMSGNREAVLVGCEGIREYAEGCISIGVKELIVQFCGENLQIRSMNEGTVVIEGIIHSVTFEKARD